LLRAFFATFYAKATKARKATKAEDAAITACRGDAAATGKDLLRDAAITACRGDAAATGAFSGPQWTQWYSVYTVVLFASIFPQINECGLASDFSPG